MPHTDPYQPGDAVRLTWGVDDPDTNLPAAGATVTLIVAPPTGTLITVPATEITAGRWRAEYVVTQVGQHAYRWTATGVVRASDSGVFYVEPHVPAVA